MTATTYAPHPERDALAAFVRASEAHPDEALVADHLRAGCLPCLLAARETALGLESDRGVADLSGLLSDDQDAGDSRLAAYISRIQRKAFLVEAEANLVPGLAAELIRKGPEARRRAVRESRRYQLLGLAEALREESRQEISRDLARSLELAELSAEVADCLDTRFYGRRTVADVRALSWGTLSNGRRVAGDFFGAERGFQLALGLLEAGTGSPMERAEISRLLASLRAEQARFKEAIQLLRQAASLYRELDLRRHEGKVLLQMGNAAFLAGHPARALKLLESSLELLDDQDDRRLRFQVQHNLVTCLNEIGLSAEARDYLEALSPLYEEFAQDRAMQLRRRWLEGRISVGLRQYGEAVSILSEVRQRFVEQEQAFEIAQVTLDLATVLLEVGDLAQVQKITKEIYPVFRSQEIHREAVAALLLFERAVTAETATAALAQDVARYLTRARNNPYLRYEPPLPIDD